MWKLRMLGTMGRSPDCIRFISEIIAGSMYESGRVDGGFSYRCIIYYMYEEIGLSRHAYLTVIHVTNI